MPAYRPIKFMNFDYYKQLSLNVSYCLHVNKPSKIAFQNDRKYFRAAQRPRKLSFENFKTGRSAS